jgi:hypothetical protein
LGQKDSALKYAQLIPEPPPYDAEFWIYVITGNTHKLEKRFSDLKKLQPLQKEDKSIYFVYLHQKDSALNQLEASIADKEFSWLKFLGVSPTWDGLRNEPRFARLVNSLNP